MTPEQNALIRRTLTKDFTQDEHDTFIAACELAGLNPFTGQIYAVGRYDKKQKRNVMAIQPSMDSYRVAAARSGCYAGQVGPLWLTGAGEWVDIWLDKKAPIAAKVGVLRTGFQQPLWAVARWESYVQKYPDGNPMGLWASSPEIMIGNAAERLALRRAGFILDIADTSETTETTEVPVATEVLEQTTAEITAGAEHPEDPPFEIPKVATTLGSGEVVRLNRTLTEMGLGNGGDDRDLKLRLINYIVGNGVTYQSSKDVPSAHFELLRDTFDSLKQSLGGQPRQTVMDALESIISEGLGTSSESIELILKDLQAKSERARNELERQANQPDPEPDPAAGDWLDQLPESPPPPGKSKGKGRVKPITEDEGISAESFRF